MTREATVDSFFEEAFEKEAGPLTALLRTPGGRLALKAGIPAAVGALAGAGTTPVKEEKLRAAARGALYGSIAAWGLRKFVRTRHAVRALSRAEAAASKAGKARAFQNALHDAVSRKILSKPQSHLIQRFLGNDIIKAVGAQSVLSYGAAKAMPYITSRMRGVMPVHEMGGLQKSSSVRIHRTKKEKPSYGKQLAAVGPAFAIKSLADIPKGVIEKSIETKALGKRLSTPRLNKALRAGLGRYAGSATLGVLTAPIFMSGIKDLQSEDKNTKARGAAKILSSGLIYQAARGAGQKVGEEARKVVGRAVGRRFDKTIFKHMPRQRIGMSILRRVKGVSQKQMLRETLALGGARAITNVPAMLGMAAGVAAGAKKSKKKSVLYGAIGGTAGGVLKGAAEVPVERILAGNLVRKGLAREALARGAGRGVAGALGGAALGALFAALASKTKPKEKKGSADMMVMWGPKTGWSVTW